MLTRGILIGKIVDELASLKYQIETRNKLGQFDLTKFVEDFFKEILNIVYQYNLVNLNSTRSNYPGLDLGDNSKAIAYQITSQKTSAKIEKTLEALTSEQLSEYGTIKIFIAGKKQSSYSIKEELIKKVKFNKESGIVDIDDLLRDIVILDIDKLEILHTLFVREFRQVKIELEPVDDKGNFESSYYAVVEKMPSSPPKNGIRFLGDPKAKDYAEEKNKLMRVYERLASAPRVTREILALIVERGKYEPSYNISEKYGILPKVLEKIMKMTEYDLRVEVDILEHAELVEIAEGEIGDREVHFLVIKGQMLNDLFRWMNEEKMSIRTLLNTMDFTILDKEENKPLK